MEGHPRRTTRRPIDDLAKLLGTQKGLEVWVGDGGLLSHGGPKGRGSAEGSRLGKKVKPATPPNLRRDQGGGYLLLIPGPRE